MPPTAEATTAVSQAMASRLTMPSGSYTDGQANTVACDSTWRTWARGSICSIQITFPRVSRTRAKASPICWAISGVSGAPASSTSWVSGSRCSAARTRWIRPFCRVIRPTKTTEGRSRSIPSWVTTSVP